MGNKNGGCCGHNKSPEQEERLGPISSLNPELFYPQFEIDDEQLEHYDFEYTNVIHYLTNPVELHTQKIKLCTKEFDAENKEVSGKLNFFQITPEEFETAERDPNKNTMLVINKRINEYASKKYLLKVLHFNYDGAEIGEDDVKNKFPLQYYLNKNVFKELRITRVHANRFILKCRGYFIHEEEAKVYLAYDFYENSLETFIRSKTLNFINKIKIFKTLLESIKTLHSTGVVSLDLSIDSIRFTSKSFHMKLVAFANSLDIASIFDIDRNSLINRKTADIHTPPEIILKRIEQINWQSDIFTLGIIMSMLFSNTVFNISVGDLANHYRQNRIPTEFYTNIDNIYIKSIIIGMLRTNPVERPNVFEVIDIFNMLVKKLDYPDNFAIGYTKEEVLGFTEIFQKSTYIILKDEETKKEHTQNQPTNHNIKENENNLDRTGINNSQHIKDNNTRNNNNTHLMINSINNDNL